MTLKNPFGYTKVCAHCGRTLHTKKEYEQEQCERCQTEYEEEMYAIYGEAFYNTWKQTLENVVFVISRASHYCLDNEYRGEMIIAKEKYNGNIKR